MLYNLVLQHLIIYTAFTLFLLLIISVITNYLFIKSTKFNIIFNFSKYLILLVVSLLFLIIFVKFLCGIFIFRFYQDHISTIGYNDVQLKYLFPYLTFKFNGSVLSDVTVMLAFSSGMVCIYLLGEKNLSLYISNVTFFSFFFIAILIMVYTTNLLVMFIGFELLFLPTLMFVFKHGYVQRIDKTFKVLLYWTLFGAFLVLSTLTYVYYKHKTLDYGDLMNINFTEYEKNIVFLSVFIGFGVKVPVFPFHYWLTKIHVEAPAGFSIFLSGFLVKAAVYCLYFFNLALGTELSCYIISTIAIFGVMESSFKMWNQTDFKKLIAFATIQEMNLILFMLANCSNTLTLSLILFILIHGWLSTLMFFVVDIIQKKTLSRNIVSISGLAYSFPAIKFPIWLIIILFTGFPLTVKFSIEWQILATLSLQSEYVMVVCFFVILVIGTVGFVRQMFIILYGLPSKTLKVNNLISKRDKVLLYFICGLLIFLNVLGFLLG